MIIDAYNTTQDRRGRSDYLSGVRPGEKPPAYTPVRRAAHPRPDGRRRRRPRDGLLARAGHRERLPDRPRGPSTPTGSSASARSCRSGTNATDEIRRFADAGLVGLKLHPSLHGYHVADHGLLDPLFEVCAELGLPVLINALDDAFCAPFAIEEIAKGFPTCRRSSPTWARSGTCPRRSSSPSATRTSTSRPRRR